MPRCRQGKARHAFKVPLPRGSTSHAIERDQRQPLPKFVGGCLSCEPRRLRHHALARPRPVRVARTPEILYGRPSGYPDGEERFLGQMTPESPDMKGQNGVLSRPRVRTYQAICPLSQSGVRTWKMGDPPGGPGRLEPAVTAGCGKNARLARAPVSGAKRSQESGKCLYTLHRVYGPALAPASLVSLLCT